mgnify:CR=1 FL=1
MSNIPFEIINNIVMNVAYLKAHRFKRVHHQILYPSLSQALSCIEHDTLWLTDTSIYGNPHALPTFVNYSRAERLPPLI